MAESSPNRKKTMWEKEKLLITSNFSFSHSVFKRLILQTHKTQSLFGKGLTLLLKDKILDQSNLEGFEDNKINDLKFELCFGKSRKHCAKNAKMLVTSIFSFSQMLSKGFFPSIVKSQDCVVEGQRNLPETFVSVYSKTLTFGTLILRIPALYEVQSAPRQKNFFSTYEI